MALVAACLALAGCMTLMLSEEDEQSACDSYRTLLAGQYVTPSLRADILESMDRLDCANVPVG